MIADEIILTNPYQEEEIKLFNNTIIVSKAQTQPPLTYKNYLSKYNVKEIETKRNTLGVYTSGIWKRKQLNIFYDKQVEKKEEQIIQAIANLVKLKPELEIIFFLHPIEKHTIEDYESAKKYYYSLLGFTNNILFADLQERNDSNFHKADLGIIPISNVIVERLYAGFKVLIVSFNENDFPMKGTSLRKICANETNEIVQKGLELLDISTKQYFSQYNLYKYHFKNFDENNKSKGFRQ
jgi:hypothetical protein